MDVSAAAERWARAWERGWPARDVDAIAALYAQGATYRSHPFREPEPGGARGYLARQFALESDIECQFGQPIASGVRAAVEWWAGWIEEGQTVTLAGATVLMFDPDGRVTEHVDYWVQADGRPQPFAGWGEE